MNNKPIGIFDSGFGGLTVARAIHERLPQESLIFFGDTERCPYGTRDLREVRGFVRQICTWLSEKDVKMIVIACNTATAAGLALAQMEFDVPVDMQYDDPWQDLHIDLKAGRQKLNGQQAVQLLRYRSG